MSIPPLVCSTPPPPEICVDDRDPDDFDLQYNLSQEDYDEGYNNENFSSYNHFESNQKPANNEEPIASINEYESENSLPNDIEANISSISKKESNDSVITGNVDINDVKVALEEESNIEDFDLELDERIEAAVSKEEVTHIETLSSCVKSIEINDLIPEPCNNQDNFITSKGNNVSINGNFEDKNELIIDELKTNDVPILNTYDHTLIENEDSENPPFEDKTVINTSEKIDVELEDDEFGEFEDFQCSSSQSKPVVATLNNIENPWINQETHDNDFGSFNANFDQLNNDSNQISDSNQQVDKEVTDHQTQSNTECDDNDFDDFHDFKSSTVSDVNTRSSEEKSSHIPLFSMNSTDNEALLYEKLNKIILDLFPIEESKEPEMEIEGKLENHLGETWGHLLETDVRQPYIVNWNNSIGQKTLLKSLCIDSRNILFGPKWNYMPKYAPNLSTAPLQPQKQPKPSSAAQSDNIDTSSKPVVAWSDPITSELQKLTYAETLLLDLEHLMATLDQMAHNHSSLKISELLSHACNTDNGTGNLPIGPTDLDVFEAAGSSKEGKIYSSTLNVQPLRQINLPDTHIFTPSDSETPRSKTIHYDSNPTILLPQPLMDNSQNRVNLPPSDDSKSENIKKTEDEAYWEFQDFQEAPSASDKNIIGDEKKSSDTTVTLGTQVLQPIKAEISAPVLNWPDPGEVKETFNDFSDFVSNTSSWPNETKVVTAPLQSQHIPTRPTVIANSMLDHEEHISNNVFDTTENSNDDFDTFQSAVPSNGPVEINTNINPVSTSIPTCSIKTFENEFSNSSQTYLASSASPLNTIPKSLILEKNITTQPCVPPLANTLQPTPISSISNYNQQNSGQILQPLSLENYSQINWPSPGFDLQDLSRFNPVETLQSLKSDLNVNSQSKGMSLGNSQKSTNQSPDDDIWGEFVSSNPAPQTLPKKSPAFGDEDEWTDFISSPTVKPQNGLNTISLNVHTSSNIQKSSNVNKLKKNNPLPLDLPTLNYITPKASSSKSYKDRQFQNL